MGLPIPSMRMIIREHKKEPFKGRVLTLGRMVVLATYEQVLNLFREEGVTAKPLEKDVDIRTNIPSMRESTGKESRFTSDVAFFKLLGVDSLETLDVSDYENADHIHDMNIQIPDKLISRFDAIFNFGTTEHIFDTRQVLDNISRMLKPGGLVLHMVGATNRIGHGFYMFSPCFFYDYYLANKFIDTRAYLVESCRGDPSFIKWKLYKYEYNSDSSIASAFYSSKAVGTFFVARKTSESTFGIVPIQGQFMDMFIKSTDNKQTAMLRNRIKRYVPLFARKLYRYFNMLRIQVKGRVARGSLEYLGKI